MNVLAIDIGHGHTKLAWRASDSAIAPVSYPSYALPGTTLANSRLTSGRKVMEVEADGVSYLVGPDVLEFAGVHAQRDRTDDYALSATHLALARGALALAPFESIDLLLVGLPLTTLDACAGPLSKRLVGVHAVPPYSGSGHIPIKNRVEIKRVEVLPQPLGALVSGIAHNPSIRHHRIATFDLGFHTLDVLISHGIKPNPARSEAVPGGVSSFIDRIQESVVREIRSRLPHLVRPIRVSHSTFEEALQRPSPHPVLIEGEEIELAHHFAQAQAQLEQQVTTALSKTGSLSEIQSFVLAGGGAELLRPVLQRMFTDRRSIVVPPDPQFAVVQGYLRYGERLLREEAKNAA